MNIALNISYDGTKYNGWQVQPNAKTVQEELECALLKVFGKEIKTTASGRTDAKVSAICQVANFECETNIPADKIMYLLNDNLPLDIRVTKSYLVNDDFNARYSAKKKTYEYYFYFGENENAFFSKTNAFFKGDLNIKNMQKACEYLVGEFDFTSFCASNTEVVSKIRTIYSAKIVEIDGLNNIYKLQISGNGFLYNMVRIIMGTLINVGYGKYNPEYINKIIELKDRKYAGPTVQALGLVLKNVEY